MANPPPVEFEDAILAPVSRITCRIEIYEADALTPFIDVSDERLLGGSVSADFSRTERRTLECTLDDVDSELMFYPDGFWYDKILKPYRGVETDSGNWEIQLGEFLIDRVVSPHFPDVVNISCRDYTKRLLLSKFGQATAFSSGQEIEDVIKTIAINGGITKFLISVTGQTLTKTFFFEAGTDRWTAVTEIATAYGYELFFDNAGYLVMREFQDPAYGAIAYILQTGEAGNLASFEKSTNDSRLYNVIQVTGDNNGVPVFAQARNDDPSSPTRVSRLGERVYRFTSTFINTEEQAQDVADKFLRIHSLEEFDLNFSSVVLPWLEVGEVIDFLDPNPAPGDPARFLLTSLSIPLGLEAMAGNAKRVRLLT